MEEQTVVYSYNVLLLSNLKNKTKHTTAFFNNMDESQKHHTELKEALHQRVHTFWGCDNFLFLNRDLSYKSEHMYQNSSQITLRIFEFHYVKLTSKQEKCKQILNSS